MCIILGVWSLENIGMKQAVDVHVLTHIVVSLGRSVDK